MSTRTPQVCLTVLNDEMRALGYAVGDRVWLRAGDRRYLIEFVEPREAERAAASADGLIVCCAPPPIRVARSLVGACARCATPIVYRDNLPPSAVKLCQRCTDREIDAQALAPGGVH